MIQERKRGKNVHENWRKGIEKVSLGGKGGEGNERKGVKEGREGRRAEIGVKEDSEGKMFLKIGGKGGRVKLGKTRIGGK